MKKFILLCSAFVLVLAGCKMPLKQNKAVAKQTTSEALKDFSFQVEPATLQVSIMRNGKTETISEPQEKRKVDHLEQSPQKVSFTYPEKKLHLQFEKKQNYLDVKLTSTNSKTNSFTFPLIHADRYTLPIAEGKTFSSKDKMFQKFYQDEGELAMAETFSMRFLAANKPDYAVSYIQDNNDNDTLKFKTEPDISLEVNHEFSSVDPKKENHYRIYLTSNEPVAIAKNYKNTLDNFKTLQEKAKQNPEIKKLYGAAHIYLWNSYILTKEDVNWQKLAQKTKAPLFSKIAYLLNKYSEDGAKEYLEALHKLENNEAYEYEKNTILSAINVAFQYEELYDKNTFPILDSKAEEYLEKGIKNLTEQERYDLNKHLITSSLQDAVPEADKWSASATTDLINEMKETGINHAWIGLPNWVHGLANPTLVSTAVKDDYLIGPYDSYQSIQENPSIDWNTASFPNKNLYENATIEKENGEKVSGFLGKGRKLNPTLIEKEVKDRISGILANQIPFNSWFLDVDAAGEIYNDYSKAHPTTKEQDIKARLKRMTYLAEEKKKALGSEGGNDFAAANIAFAHGIETPVIKWSDPDMRQNEESEYYVGSYNSPDGLTPSRYGKAVPIKEEYKPIYTDPKYSVPLYKLVYNNSVITTHHWEWDSYKIKSQTGERRLMEYLYNVPPLFHLDKNSWQKRKSDIIKNMNSWQPFQKEALKHEMTNFEWLTDNHLVQRTTFGDTLTVTANFSAKVYQDQTGKTVQPHTAFIQNGNQEITITTDNL